MKTLVNAIHTAIMAMNTCNANNNPYAETWLEKLGQYETALSHGSGIDNGTSIDIEKTTKNRIILHTAFHHMDENGFYDGWTYHDIIVAPTFDGIDITVTGKNRNDIKTYLTDIFYESLMSDAELINMHNR